MKLRTVILTPVLLAGLVAGCTTQPKATAQTNKGDDEYVTVVTTGSNIPKRIKKSDIEQGKVAKDTLAETVDKDEFSRNLRPGLQTDKGAGR